MSHGIGSVDARARSLSISATSRGAPAARRVAIATHAHLRCVCPLHVRPLQPTMSVDFRRRLGVVLSVDDVVSKIIHNDMRLSDYNSGL